MARIKAIEIRKAYGQQSVTPELDGFGAGLNVVYGPNASGKSTLARTASLSLGYTEAEPGIEYAAVTFEDPSPKNGADKTVTIITGKRQAAPPTPPPDNPVVRQAYHLSLRDLLEDDDSDVVEEIRRIASGGIDIRPIIDQLAESQRTPRNLTKNLTETVAALRTAKGHEAEIAKNTARLAELSRERDALQAAHRRKTALEAAKALHAATSKKNERMAELGQLDPRLSHLREGDLADYTEALSELRNAEDALRSGQAVLDELKATLPPKRLDEQFSLNGFSPKLMAWQQARDTYLNQVTLVEQREHAIEVEGLPTATANSPLVNQRDVDQLDTLYQEKMAAQQALFRHQDETNAIDAELSRIDEQIASLPPLPDGFLPQLLNWFRVGSNSASPRRIRIRRGLTLGLFLLVALSLILASSETWSPLLSTGLGVLAIVITVLSWILSAPGKTPTGTLLSESLAKAVGATTFTDAVAEDSLKRVSEQQALMAEREALRRKNLHHRAQETTKRANMDDCQSAFNAHLKKLRVEQGDQDLRVLLVVAELRRQNERIFELAAARRTLTAMAGTLTEKTNDLLQYIAPMERHLSLTPLEEGGSLHSERLAQLTLRFDEIKMGADQVARSRQAYADKQRDVNVLAQNVKHLEKPLRQIYQRIEGAAAEGATEPGDLASLATTPAPTFDADAYITPLTRLMDQREAYVSLTQEVADLSREIARTSEVMLREDEALRLEEPHQIDQALAQIDADAGKLDELNERAGKLKEQLRHASNDFTIQEKTDRASTLMEQLRDHRSKRAVGNIQQYVLEEAERWAREKNLPEVLLRADTYFREVTGHRYQLVFSGTSSIAAQDTVLNRPFALHELSDGTRIQLKFCVRLAFLEQAESTSGYKRPLIVDEALANSDDDRIYVLIDALMRFAGDRQVIYFTAQADEVHRIQARAAQGNLDVTVHTLAPLPTNALRETTRIPLRPAIPSPNPTLSYESWGEQLQIPAWNPWEELSSLHLWYLSDSADDIYTALREGITRVGTFRGLSEDMQQRIVHRPDRLRALYHALDAWQSVYRQHHARPLGIQEVSKLAEACSLNQRYEASARAFVEQHDTTPGISTGDALLMAMRNRSDGFSRFHEQVADRVEEWMLEGGYLIRQEQEMERPNAHTIRMAALNAATSRVRPQLDAEIIGLADITAAISRVEAAMG